MNVFSKVMVVLILLLSAGFAASQMVLYAKREKWQLVQQETLTELQDSKGRAATLAKERSDLQRSRDSIKLEKESKIDQLQTELDGLKSQMNDLRATLSKREDNLDGARTEIAKLVETLLEQVKHIEDVNSANLGFKESLRLAEEKVKGVEDELLAMEKNVQALQLELAELEKGERDVIKERDHFASIVERFKRMGWHVEVGAVPIVDGKVVGVDPDLGAVVINKGSKHNVRVAFPFTIYRGEDLVAKVTVVEVHEEFCLALAEKGFFDKEKPMAVGDDATTRVY